MPSAVLFASHASATEVWVTEDVRRFGGAESPVGVVPVGGGGVVPVGGGGVVSTGGGGASHAEVETVTVDFAPTLPFESTPATAYW